jgi:hypothetical protein
MATEKYPNKADCYYVSWDNTLLTGILFGIETVIFILIWVLDATFVSIAINVLIISLLASIANKFLAKSTSYSLKPLTIPDSFYKQLFEWVYNTLNNTIDRFFKHSSSQSGIFLLFGLFMLSFLNLSVFTIVWLYSLWSFANPAMIKFLNFDIQELLQAFATQNSLKDKLNELYSSIPKSSGIKYQD